MLTNWVFLHTTVPTWAPACDDNVADSHDARVPVVDRHAAPPRVGVSGARPRHKPPVQVHGHLPTVAHLRPEGEPAAAPGSGGGARPRCPLVPVDPAGPQVTGHEAAALVWRAAGCNGWEGEQGVGGGNGGVNKGAGYEQGGWEVGC